MLSHSIFLGNNRSELQFIDDLNNLCRRHKIHCGEHQDLAHLGADLVSNDNFRTDLFTLCAAISHMAEIDLTPEQLLILVVRALGGPGVSVRDVTVDLPEAASSAFLNGYESWLRREPDPDTSRPRHTEPEQTPPSSHPGPTLFYSAASRFRSDAHETHDDLTTIAATNRTAPRRSIPGNTPLEDLTLNELRLYLEDIENRVNRIEPRLERIVPRKHPSDEHFEQLEALDSQHEHEATATAAANHPEPAPAPDLTELAVAAPETELALVDIASSSLIVPHPDTIIVETPPLKQITNPTTAAAHVHRLRIVNGILTSLLILVCASAAVFAYRYLYLQPASLTDAVNRLPAPLRDLAAKPSPATQTTPAAPANTGASGTSSIPAPVHRPNDATQDKIHNANSPEASPTLAPIHTSNADPPPLADTKIPSLSATLPYETPVAPHANQHTIATLPPETHPQPIAPLVASATSPTPKPVNTPITHPALPPNAVVAVPSSMMMAYAISAPKPVYPSFRHAAADSSVDVEAKISKEGKVIAVRAINGPIDVRGPAMQAVQSWRFKPFTLDGTPVAVITTFKFVFKAR
jgi:hypothetical protein